MEQIVQKWCDNDEKIAEFSKELRELRKEQKELIGDIVAKLQEKNVSSLITARGKRLEISSTLKKVKKKK